MTGMCVDPPSRPSATYLRDVARAWDRFVAREPIDTGKVRPVVIQSWTRCLAGGVDPRRGTAGSASAVPGPARAGRLDLVSTSVDACADRVASRFGTAEIAILATDPQGTLLNIRGHPAFVEKLQSRWAFSGASWREESLGTNAVGTALALGRLVSIHGHEHFCEAGKAWNCHAVPIRDPFDRRILGVLDITHSRLDHGPDCRRLLVEAAGQVEYEIARTLGQDHALLLSRLDELPSGGEGFAAIDRHGRIVGLHGRNADQTMRVGDRIADLRPDDGESLAALLPGSDLIWRDARAGAIIRLPMNGQRRVSARPARRRPSPFGMLLAASPSLAGIADRAGKFAARNIPTLIIGETGTGKELFARAIHDAVARDGAPFVAINCAAIPKDLIASELFGYADGAFTGARRGGAPGRIEKAHGGTLFLDEISDMPADLQPYLLRVLEERELSRLGETATRKVEFRLITASNRPLAVDVAEGRFRPDLYHRINIGSLELPPLRDRGEDFLPLIRHLLAEIARDGDPAFALEDGVLEALMRHDWPGNVRELRNALECATALSVDGRLRPEHFPMAMKRDRATPVSPVRGMVAMADAEDETIRAAMAASKGRVAEAAAMIGVSRATLYRRLAKARRPAPSA